MVISEIPREYNLLTLKDKVILEFGSNIGAAARYFYSEGAKQVISIEPDIDNFSLVTLNKWNDKHIIINKVVVTDEDPEILKLYLGSYNRGIHSLNQTRGRESIDVQTISLNNLLNTYKPDGLKMDVEGYEFKLLQNNLSYKPSEIIVEFHFVKKNDREYTKSCIEKLKSQGYECVKVPRFENTKVWDDIGFFKLKEN